jgi:CHAT domain-containing protein
VCLVVRIRFSGTQLSYALMQSCPSLSNPDSPAALEKMKLQQSVLSVCVRFDDLAKVCGPGQMTPEVLESMNQVLQQFQDLATAAAPGNEGLPFVYYQMAHTAEFLAKGCIQLGRNEKAATWFAHAAEWFEKGEEPKHAAACRDLARNLQVKLSGDLDTAAGDALNVIVSPSESKNPMDRAAAFIRLSEVAYDAGDLFEAIQNADSAVKELGDLGYPDPLEPGVENAVSLWIDTATAKLTGISLLGQLSQVATWYMSIYNVRLAAMLKKDMQAAEGLQAQLTELQNMIHRIQTEAEVGRVELSREWGAYAPVPQKPSEASSAQEAGPAGGVGRMQSVDDALLAVRQECNSRAGAEDPMEDLLARLDQIQEAAAALKMPLYDAKVLLERAYVMQALARAADVLPLVEAARAKLLGDRPASLGSFTQGFERSYYLDAFSNQAMAQIVLKDFEGVLTTCEEVIRDFETERYRVNSQFRQSAILNAVVNFYKWAAFAAFKLSRWDSMLEAIELIKARSAIHSRLLPEAPDLSESDLAREFEQVSKALEQSGAEAEPDLVARRRHLWDLLAIVRARGATAKDMPALTVAAVQSAVAEDEALIGYFWLSESTLLVMAVDHERFMADRVNFKPDELEDLDDFVKALQELRGVSRAMDKSLRRFADTLLPPFCRAFVAGKQRLILSPHHALHLIPIHALPWDAEFVGTRFATRYVPNFSSLLLPWESKCENRVLAIGIKRFADPSIQPLANVEDDALAIAESYSAQGAEAELLLGIDASRMRVEQLRGQGVASRFRCLHLGTHGLSVFDTPNQPMESKLLLQDAALDSMDIAGLRFHAELAVISACNSGQRAIAGRDMGEFPGDDIFGLQSALFQSGVLSVLGTLWLVETESSSAIIRAFHRHFASGAPADKSLQLALKEYLDISTKNKECFYWAPYFISSLGSITNVRTA